MKRRANQQLGPAAKKRKTTATKSHPKRLPRVKSKMMTPELKAVDTSIVTTIGPGITAAGHTTLANGIVLGTDRFNRIGRKVHIKSFHARISLYPNVVAPAATENILIMMVLDRDTDTGAGLPPLGDILQNVSQTGTATTSIQSMVNLNSTQRFLILHKKIIPFRITSSPSEYCNQSDGAVQWEWYVPMDIITSFNSGNSGGAGDIENNALYVVYYTDKLGANLSSIELNTRVRYYD